MALWRSRVWVDCDGALDSPALPSLLPARLIAGKMQDALMSDKSPGKGKKKKKSY